jgi:hypothetical protein
LAIIGAHRIVLSGITAVVLHDFDLRVGNTDDLKSVVDELKVVVSENGDLDCARKSPEELEDSKASQLLKELQPDALDVEALTKLLAIATAAKNCSESIDLTDDATDDLPQISPNQASDSIQVKVEAEVEDEQPPDFPDRLSDGALRGPIGGELVPPSGVSNLGVALREAASTVGQTSSAPTQVDSARKRRSAAGPLGAPARTSVTRWSSRCSRG